MGIIEGLWAFPGRSLMAEVACMGPSSELAGRSQVEVSCDDENLFRQKML